MDDPKKTFSPGVLGEPDWSSGAIPIKIFTPLDKFINLFYVVNSIVYVWSQYDCIKTKTKNQNQEAKHL